MCHLGYMGWMGKWIGRGIRCAGLKIAVHEDISVRKMPKKATAAASSAITNAVVYLCLGDACCVVAVCGVDAACCVVVAC